MGAMNGEEKAGGTLPAGIWLALDTSTASMTVALAREGRVTAEKDSRSERNHSIRLLPEVESLLAEANLEPKGLAAIAVGRGPGSYTGIRIGVTVAKMMAWSLHVPLFAVSSLEALAYGAVQRGLVGETGAGSVWIVPLMDARRGKAYTGLYAFGPEGWRCLEQDGIRPMEEWLGRLAERLQAERAAGEGSIAESAAGEGLIAESAAGEGSIAESAAGEGLIPESAVGEGSQTASPAMTKEPAGGNPPEVCPAETGKPADAGRGPGGAVRILFVGDYAGFQDLLDGFAARVPVPVATDDSPLSASAVAALAWMHGERCRVDDPHSLLPNYTQLSEPEKKLAAKLAALKP